MALIRNLACAALACAALASSFDAATWRQAQPGYAFQFPLDHRSHPEYRIEWWYYTGNLRAGDGRRFGYQLTFFRVGVDYSPANPSRWAVRDLFMAHLAVSDIDGGRFRFSELLNRAGPGWAGADAETYRVWNEGWEARLDPAGDHRLRASADGIGVDLTLAPGKPPVLHGERGYSRKGPSAGNASEYYSLTRMPTRGQLTVDGRQFDVQGASWMDHEFGTSFLEGGQTGWDWFSLQLEDGRDLMLFQLRLADGSRSPYSSGTLVDSSGGASPLRADEFELLPGRAWKSPASGYSYPLEWLVRIPGKNLHLTVRAALDDQELRTTRSTGVTYYEGAVTAQHALGYLEMTRGRTPGN